MRDLQTQEYLEELSQMVSVLESTTSPSEKMFTLQLHGTLQSLLKKVYDPRYLLHVTGDNVAMYLMCTELGDETTELSLLELLDNLHTRTLTGGSALHECAKFINTYHEWEPIIIRVLNKDLSCGIGVKTINEVFPTLIAEFTVPLAKDYKRKSVDFDRYQWFVSRKMNGIRCLCFLRSDGSVTCMSRNGLPFNTLGRLEREIKERWSCDSAGPRDIILDGEVCILRDGVESFTGITSEFRRKNHTIENPVFFVFDLYGIQAFEEGDQSFRSFATSYKILQMYFQSMFKGCSYMKLLPHYELRDEDHLEEFIENRPKNWEGLILRRGDHTVFRRSRRLQKIKSFQELDAVVLGVDVGHKVMGNEDRLCASAIIINPSGTLVRVGSGLSDEQRLQWLDSSKIVGKVVTVKYFEESSNKRGGRSLQFPTLKEVRDYE